MFRRVCLIAALLMILPLASPAQVSAKQAFAEGIDFGTSLGPPGSAGSFLSFNATKRVDGNWRQTTVQISRHNVGVTTTVTGILNGDPDGLEVSRDLGWGGLDGQATLTDTKTGEQHLYEFHLRSTATQHDYTEDPTTWYFNRPSLIEGVILMDGATRWQFPVTGTYAHAVTGSNFSDQWPGY